MLQRDAPRLDGFGGVARSQNHHVGHGAQTRQLLDRLMGRAVLSERDTVVGPDVDHVRLAQRREPDARSHVVGERQERRAKREKPIVKRHPSHHRGHGVLAKAEVNVSSRVPPDAAGRALCRHLFTATGPSSGLSKSPHPFIAVRVDGSRSAEPPTRFVTMPASALMTAPPASRVAMSPSAGVKIGRCASQRCRELAGERVRKLGGQAGMCDPERVHAAPPRRFELSASLDGRSKFAQSVLRHIEAAIFWPSQRALRQTHLLDTERLTVRVPCVLLVRAAVSDMRARHDQRRSILDGPRHGQRRIHGRGILAVDLLHVPAIGFEARADVLCRT